MHSAMAIRALSLVAGIAAGRALAQAPPDPGPAFNCSLPAPLDPSGDGLPSGRDVFGSEEALRRQVGRLGDAVRVESVTYDDMGDVDADERWRPFSRLHETLRQAYPAV